MPNLKLNSPRFFQNHPEKATFEKKVQNTCSFGSKMSFLNNQQDSNDRSKHGTPDKRSLPRSGTGKLEPLAKNSRHNRSTSILKDNSQEYSTPINNERENEKNSDRGSRSGNSELLPQKTAQKSRFLTSANNQPRRKEKTKPQRMTLQHEDSGKSVVSEAIVYGKLRLPNGTKISGLVAAHSLRNINLDGKGRPPVLAKESFMLDRKENMDLSDGEKIEERKSIKPKPEFVLNKSTTRNSGDPMGSVVRGRSVPLKRMLSQTKEISDEDEYTETGHGGYKESPTPSLRKFAPQTLNRGVFKSPSLDSRSFRKLRHSTKNLQALSNRSHQPDPQNPPSGPQNPHSQTTKVLSKSSNFQIQTLDSIEKKKTGRQSIINLSSHKAPNTSKPSLSEIVEQLEKKQHTASATKLVFIKHKPPLESSKINNTSLSNFNKELISKKIWERNSNNSALQFGFMEDRPLPVGGPKNKLGLGGGSRPRSLKFIPKIAAQDGVRAGSGRSLAIGKTRGAFPKSNLNINGLGGL